MRGEDPYGIKCLIMSWYFTGVGDLGVVKGDWEIFISMWRQILASLLRTVLLGTFSIDEVAFYSKETDRLVSWC